MNKKTNKPKVFPQKGTSHYLWVDKIFKILKSRKISFSDLITLSALILSVVAFFRDCSQENTIQNNQYALNQNEYRPNLKIIKSEIHNVKVIINDDKYKIKNVDEFLKLDSNKIQDIRAELEFYAKTSIVNIGNARAKLHAEFYTDTTSGGDFLRESLIKGPLSQIDTFADYYSISEINSGDTIVLDRYFKVQRIEDKMFTLHVLFLYENEIGQLFDTYFWARFKSEDVEMRRVFIPEKNMLITQVKQSDMENMINLIDFNSSSKLYNRVEAKKIQKKIAHIFENENLK